MTEQEYVISIFEEKFKEFAGKKIVLHGSRNYAQAILGKFDGQFHFQGILTFDDTGESFCGKPVLQKEDLPRLKTEMIILTERVKYAEAAYQDLQSLCVMQGIRLFNMYGLDEIAVHREIASMDPSERITIDEWEKRTDPYSVVAFEVMDVFLFPKQPGMRWIVDSNFEKLYRYLRSAGKPVFFSLRKSVPEEEQVEALWETGLFEDRMSLETSLIRREGEDLSFRTVREANTGKILYLGYGIVNECILPRCYGIDTCRVWHSILPCRPVPIVRELPEDYDLERLADRIKSEIKNHDIISFDVFDTLVVRRTLQPSDVFLLLERRIEDTGIRIRNFAELRMQAEAFLIHQTLPEIYLRLHEMYGIPEELTEKIMEEELRLEEEILLPRGEVVKLAEYAKSQWKTVILTSDMYIQAAVLKDLLRKKGIDCFDEIYVSCEYRQGKEEGLFDKINQIFRGKKILHIGDNQTADIKAAEAAGIDSVLIPSVLFLACRSGWKPSVACAKTLAERCLLGSAVAKSFLDPFQPAQLSEMTMDQRLIKYGNSALGPLLVGYISWLISKIAGAGYKKILFLSRDGYLLYPVYEKLRKDWPLLDLPEAMYCYANRHSAFLFSAERNMDTVTERIWNGLTPEQVLRVVLDLDEDEVLHFDPVSQDKKTYFLQHTEKIKSRSRREKAAFAAYAERNGIDFGSRCVVVDGFGEGTIHAALEAFFEKELAGFLIGRGWALNGKNQHITYYLNYRHDFLLKNYMEIEGYLTAPEPALDHYSSEGEPVFQSEIRTDDEMKTMQRGQEVIREYMEDFFRLFYRPGEVISPELAEEMYMAEGYHWVSLKSYDDWTKKEIKYE